MPHPVPSPNLISLNPHVLELLRTYPTDGTHGYHWVDGFDGVTVNLIYQNEVIAKAEAQRRTYCCGLTLEVYLLACERYARLRGAKSYRLDELTPGGVRKLKSDWFVATGKRGGPVDALIHRGLGVKIPVIEEALPGDFIQLWRESGSGHSVIFLGLEDGGLRYWSTQASTKGIGERSEKFNVVKKDELYIARAFLPVAEGN